MFKPCPYASTVENVIAALDAISTLEQQLRIGILRVGTTGNDILHVAGKTPSDFLGLIRTDASHYGHKLIELAGELPIGNHIPLTTSFHTSCSQAKT
jgi:hypothetical protein